MDSGLRREIFSEVVCLSLIGREVEVVSSLNGSLVGVCGKVVSESASLLFVETKSGVKKVLKAEVVLGILLNGERFEVEGKVLQGTLVGRIKKFKG